jgi:hypothetical protein
MRADSGLDAFVSYSRRDQTFVNDLKEALERRGRNVWIDSDEFRRVPHGGANSAPASRPPTRSCS